MSWRGRSRRRPAVETDTALQQPAAPRAGLAVVVVAVLILITIVAAATAFYVADHDARPADSVGMAAHDTRDRTLVGGNRPVTREGPPS